MDFAKEFADELERRAKALAGKQIAEEEKVSALLEAQVHRLEGELKKAREETAGVRKELDAERQSHERTRGDVVKARDAVNSEREAHSETKAALAAEKRTSQERDSRIRASESALAAERAARANSERVFAEAMKQRPEEKREMPDMEILTVRDELGRAKTYRLKVAK